MEVRYTFTALTHIYVESGINFTVSMFHVVEKYTIPKSASFFTMANLKIYIALYVDDELQNLKLCLSKNLMFLLKNKQQVT